MLTALAAAAVVKAAAFPNIVLIIADDLGYGDLSCTGGDIPTPHIDSIAFDGVRLDSFYTTASVCTPSRFSMMTGKYPMRAQGGLGGVQMILDNRHDSNGFRPGEVTIGEALQERGYRTGLMGKWHLGHGTTADLPTRHGFDEFYGASGGCIDYYFHRYGFRPDWYRGENQITEEGYATRLLTDESVKFIESTPADQPMFLVVSEFAPHYGKSYLGDENSEETTMYTRSAGKHKDPVSGATEHLQNTLQAPAESIAEFADTENKMRRIFKGMVREMDDSVGEVLAAIDRTGRRDSTLVIFVADNGPDETVSSAGDSGYLRGAKHSLYEGGVRVPCVMRYPRMFEPNTASSKVVSALDFFPTIAGLAGAEQPDGLDGADFIDILDGTNNEQRSLVWRQGSTHSIRRGDWKLIGKQLYNVATDVSEKVDRAKDLPGLAAALKADRDRLIQSIK